MCHFSASGNWPCTWQHWGYGQDTRDTRLAILELTLQWGRQSDKQPPGSEQGTVTGSPNKQNSSSGTSGSQTPRSWSLLYRLKVMASLCTCFSLGNKWRVLASKMWCQAAYHTSPHTPSANRQSELGFYTDPLSVLGSNPCVKRELHHHKATLGYGG
jgi:hypothetical protein